jgi:hypothetical protein
MPGLGETPQRTQVAWTETLDGEGGAQLGRPKAGFVLGDELWVARWDADLDTGGPGHGGFRSGAAQLCSRLLHNSKNASGTG